MSYLFLMGGIVCMCQYSKSRIFMENGNAIKVSTHKCCYCPFSSFSCLSDCKRGSPPPLLWQAAAALRLTLVSTEKLSLKQEALTKDPVLNDCKSYCNAWANCRQIKDTNRNPQVLSINWFPCHILIWEYSMVCTGFHRSHTYMGGFKISPQWIR